MTIFKGHGEAAVKLQRDWISDPQSLPFAQHIKTHALVVLVQKGLQYYDIEQSINQVRRTLATHSVMMGIMVSEIDQNGTRSSPSSSALFFGPQSGRATSSPKEEASEEETALRFSPRTRKHGRDGIANGLQLDLPTAAPPAKRSRRSNGADGTNGDGRGNDSMDYELIANAHSHNLDHGRGNASSTSTTNGNGHGNGDANSYSRPEAPEPTSNINSPAEESQSQIPMGLEGANMDIDDDAPAPDAERQTQHQQQQQNHQHQQHHHHNKQQHQDEEHEHHEHDHEHHQHEQQDQHEHEHEQDEQQQQEQQQQEQQHDERARRSLTLTLANGNSVGVQSDKVAELGPETTTLTIPDKNVLHTAWNPRDPAILATGGDALCRIWSTEPSATPESPRTPAATPTPKEPQYVDILDPSDASFVTNMAWSPDGELIVIATHNQMSEGAGAVSLWAKNGKSIDELPAAQDMVLIFRWNPSGTHLLGVTSSGTNTSALIIWDIQSSQALPPFQLDRVITDAAWSDDGNFVICGPGIIAESTVDEETITGIRIREDVDKEQKWTRIQHDTSTNTTAFAAESAMLGVVDSSGKFQMTKAHSADITALAFQRIRNHSTHPLDSPRLLVTSSVDGNIKVWDAKLPLSTIHVLSLGRSVPAMAISFTPDGYLVAAASWNRILIWNAETGGAPKASWRGEVEKWQGLMNGVDQDSGIGEEEDGPTHSLDWDADGRKLAYGLGSRVSFPCCNKQGVGSVKGPLLTGHAEDCDYQLSTITTAKIPRSMYEKHSEPS